MSTLVLQSTSPKASRHWITQCIDSVERWAAKHRFAYRLVFDELFEIIPRDVSENLVHNILPKTDIGRLLWIKKLLSEGWKRVVWVDADVLIFAPDRFQIPAKWHHGVSAEAWVTKKENSQYVVNTTLNNSIMFFSSTSQLLETYINLCFEIAKQRRNNIRRNEFGPLALAEIYNVNPISLIPGTGLLSPIVLEELAEAKQNSAHILRQVHGEDILAVNLCGSLGLDTSPVKIIDDEIFSKVVIELLLSNGSLLNAQRPRGDALFEITHTKTADSIW